MAQSKKTRKKSRPQPARSNGFYFHIAMRVLQSLLVIAVCFVLLLGALGAGIGAGYFAYLVEDTKTPTKKELQSDLGDINETSHLVYADDSNIATIRSDLRRTSVDSKKISKWLKTAVIATEDENFYQHKGFVPKAVIRALISEVTGLGSSGGSTLTQQIVKQQILSDEVTFKRKANEILIARQVEQNFSKDEIVTMYLNVSPFGRNNRGENIAGAQEAAKGIFGKDASKLTLPQAAFIAGLPQSPIIYSPYSNTGELRKDLSSGLERKDYVLFSMYRNHDISKKEYLKAKKYDLKKDFLKKGKAEDNEQGFLYHTVMNDALEIIVDKLAKEDGIKAKDLKKDSIYQKYLQKAQNQIANGGYIVKTTLNKNIYQAMQDTAKNYGYLLDGYDGQAEVGNVYMDNKTGKVLGFVGGRDYSKSQFNHAFDSKRPAGSAIKPVLVYGPAIDQGFIGSESRVSDYPTDWQSGENKGDPIVNATNRGTKTFQTVRVALEKSSNIAAYHVYQNTLNQKGDKAYVYDNYLKKMNYPATDYWQYEAASSGIPEITTLTQTNGFQTLANGGVYQQGYLIESIKDTHGQTIYQHKEDPQRVYSKQTASIMNDLLRSVINRAYTSPFKATAQGLNWEMGNADWVGKTGTTDDYKDAWLVVSTPKATLGSWSGREDNKATDNQAGKRTGTYLAYMANAIYNADPDSLGVNEKFTLDGDIKKEKVNKFTGTQPGGSIRVDNYTTTAPKETVTSYWATGTPPAMSFKFGLGGTDANYADYWKTARTTPAASAGNPRQNRTNNNAANNNNNDDDDDAED